jgi:hypothetical protein
VSLVFTMPMRSALSVFCLFAAPAVLACSTCMVGDPTLTLMGAEKPYEDRLRFSVDYLSRSEELGRDGFNKKDIEEQRVSLSLAYAPSSRLMFGVNLPYVNRQLQAFNLAQEEVSAVGDVSVTFKNFMQAAEFLQKHMYGLLGGIKFPTASEAADASGVPLDFDVQAGQGATVINAGGWYAHYNYPYMFYTSMTYHKASEGYQDFQAGDALVYNATAQYASQYSISYYLGLEGRSSRQDSFAGIDDPDSGGTIIFIAPGFIYTLLPDLLLNATVKLPAIDALTGDHSEGPIFNIGLTYDFKMH